MATKRHILHKCMENSVKKAQTVDGTGKSQITVIVCHALEDHSQDKDFVPGIKQSLFKMC